jgi:hypothetical protein
MLNVERRMFVHSFDELQLGQANVGVEDRPASPLAVLILPLWGSGSNLPSAKFPILATQGHSDTGRGQFVSLARHALKHEATMLCTQRVCIIQPIPARPAASRLPYVSLRMARHQPLFRHSALKVQRAWSLIYLGTTVPKVGRHLSFQCQTSHSAADAAPVSPTAGLASVGFLSCRRLADDGSLLLRKTAVGSNRAHSGAMVLAAHLPDNTQRRRSMHIRLQESGRIQQSNSSSLAAGPANDREFRL